MFLSQSGGRSLPSALPPLVPPKRTSTAQPAPRSSFAVVINSSPSKQSEAALRRTVEDDADDLMTSGFSPQFRKLAAQAALDVSLAKPALPTSTTDEPDVASPGTSPLLPQPRKRGRPKGFRPNRPGTKTLQDEPPTTGPRKLRPDRPKTGALYAGKRRGRPPKAPSPQPRTIYEGLNPHFIVFICEWEGCRAELHNFATLRKHVLVVHARAEPFACRWAQCAEQQPAHIFSTSAHLKSHLEGLHMPPIAWQVGDGPQVSFKRYVPDNGTELPGYLFDKAGHQVTPSIRDQKEEDFYTWRNNRRRLKNLLLLRDQNMPSDGEDNGTEETTEER
ncbi:uncharacterized protein LY79DRAFT_511670 [Colletotrichum navitas]|uniref:C2H2-type domain-containing protein n=1 Tax=Colletotrichum navitas TaxID=681940 RepID=A0AAD8Q388_9PEZI|nr:uncharacterized protein LY79DRAFT_511670 [Colletotrichum navitas]KAK1594983.1 hypothetical protein LY79DRAFT_511670 [Colletotrichum navitas]